MARFVYTFDARRALLVHSHGERQVDENRPCVAVGGRWEYLVRFFRTCAEKSLHAGAIRPSCGRTVAFRLSVVAPCPSVPFVRN